MSLFPPGKKRRQFFTAQACVLVCAIIVMTKAMIGGAINEYNMPFSTWPVELYVSEFFMITIYSVVFTLLLSVPLWYWFIGEQDRPLNDKKGLTQLAVSPYRTHPGGACPAPTICVGVRHVIAPTQIVGVRHVIAPTQIVGVRHVIAQTQIVGVRHVIAQTQIVGVRHA